MPAGISNASSAVGNVSVLNGNLAAGRTLIYKNGFIANSTDVFYTVTAGKTFYLISVSASVSASVANSNRSYVWFGGVIPDGVLLVFSGPQSAGNQNQALSFPHPIPIAAGEEINCSTEAATTKIAAAICGWEE